MTKHTFEIDQHGGDDFEPVTYWVVWELESDDDYTPLARFPTKEEAEKWVADWKAGTGFDDYGLPTR